jgi:hypothetical protein
MEELREPLELRFLVDLAWAELESWELRVLEECWVLCAGGNSIFVSTKAFFVHPAFSLNTEPDWCASNPVPPTKRPGEERIQWKRPTSVESGTANSHFSLSTPPDEVRASVEYAVATPAIPAGSVRVCRESG